MDKKSTGSKKLEQYIGKLEERRELEAMNEYNPFGRGGAGAPLKDINGNLINTKKNNYENQTNFNSYPNKIDSNNPDNYQNKKRENLDKNFHSNYDANQMGFNNGPQHHQQLNNLNNSNYAFQNQSNLNGNYGNNSNNMNQQPINNYPTNYQNYQNQNQNPYSNEISNVNMRNNHNNQYLNNIMSNINIGAQDNSNTVKNRTLSANMILDQNKNIYSQNIINDINRVYEESSKVQNYNHQNDLDISRNQPLNNNNNNNNNNIQKDRRNAPNFNHINNSPLSNYLFILLFYK